MKRIAIMIFAAAATACAPSTPMEAPPAAAPAKTAWTFEKAMNGSHRSATNRARNEYRNPDKTLRFFGVQPNMHVIEIWPGRGWYSEILAPVLSDRGKFVAASFGPDSSPDYRPRLHAAFLEKMANEPELYGNAEVIVFDPPAHASLGEPGTADVVLTFRNTHSFIRAGVADDVFRAAYEVLKPGGVLGVVQHRGVPGADPAESSKKGYVPESHVVFLAERAGFELAARSEINANPKDTKDYEDGVWTLPPSLRKRDVDRAKYLAIGESDRMTLKFVKPRS